MFPKGNMTRNVESIRERIPTMKTFMFGSVAKKTTEVCTTFQFCMFMWWKENKTCIAKYFKIRVVGRGNI